MQWQSTHSTLDLISLLCDLSARVGVIFHARPRFEYLLVKRASEIQSFRPFLKGLNQNNVPVN